jgi:hypothetical protein
MAIDFLSLHVALHFSYSGMLKFVLQMPFQIGAMGWRDARNLYGLA